MRGESGGCVEGPAGDGTLTATRPTRLTKELKSYYSANRLILTGTPVHNNLAELWSLLNFILPDVFDNLEEFERWFDFGDLHSEGGSARLLSREQSQRIISTLRDILDPFILQREKKHVEKDLPPKKEYILYAPLTVQQRDLYQEVLNNSIRARLTEMMTELSWEEIKATEVLQAGEGWDRPLRRGEQASNQRCKWAQDSSSSSPRSSKAATPNGKRRKREVEGDGCSEDDERSITQRRTPRKGRRGDVVYNGDDESEAAFMKRMEDERVEQDEPRILTTADVQQQAREHAVRQAAKDIGNMRLQNPVMQLRKICGHPFLFYWPKDRVTGQPVINEDLLNASGKLLMLNRLLDALWARNHKVLLFSQVSAVGVRKVCSR